MNRILPAVAAILFLVPSTARAQLTQEYDTWVASTGNDANNCARTTPCTTFTRAFAQTVPAGVIHVVDGGCYGTLAITHAITIEGGGATTQACGNLYFGPNQFTISAGASDVVTIRNLTISGARISSGASAIRANSVGALHVQDCVFTAFIGRVIDFEATSGYLTMKNVTIGDTPAGVGVYVANARASLENIAVHNTQTAVIAAGAATVSVARSSFNGNSAALVAAYGPTAQINIDECVMTNNQWAVVAGGGATAYVGRSSMFNNYIKALYNDGASFLVSYGTNQFAGNATDGTFTALMVTK